VHAPARSFNFNFHSKTDKKDAAKKGDYEKSFEDMLGKTQSTGGQSMEEQIKQR
jgi:hypothetical protein